MNPAPRVLYVAHRFDYGNPDLGPGFEHYNFFDTLHRLGLDVLYFDIGMEREIGREAMQRRLTEVVAAEKPDASFFVLFRDELAPETIRDVTASGHTKTVNWFCDDHWRFEDFTSVYAPHFNLCTTTANSALPKYAAAGVDVVKTQWAANPFLYRPPEGVEPGAGDEHEVSFIGRLYGRREANIGRIEAAGFRVSHWGPGSARGKIDQDGMIRVFGSSKISLNFSASSAPKRTAAFRAKVAVARTLKTLGVHGALKSANAALRGKQRTKLFETPDAGHADQIKGRNFEVPACGGFLLSGQAEDLSTYYDLGREVVCYDNDDDLIEKVRHYATRDDERRAIARAGYERTLREHTYVHRLCPIFERLGAPLGDPDELLAAGDRPGVVVDVAPSSAAV